MSNTNTDYLFPEFWASSFDEMDQGQYQLQNLVSRGVEQKLAESGDTVNVPVQPDMNEAGDWTPGDAINPTALTQLTKPVILNESKASAISLTGKELSLSPYNLIQTYGIPMAQSVIEAVNNSIYKCALGSTYFQYAGSSLDEDALITAGTTLSNNKVSRAGRKLVLAPTDHDTLMKLDAFQHADVSGNTEVMQNGMLSRKMGFDIYENNIISKYTAADVSGAVNNKSTAYAAGATTIAVDGFNDDANPVRVGDIFIIADETGTPKHTVTATTKSSSDTVSITFSPAIIDGAADDAVITITPTRSLLAMTSNAIAFAARAYSALPVGVGVNSQVFMIQGLPVRISTWHDGKLGVCVQYDILYGCKLVNDKRLVRIVTV